jgi:hypothetical protein
MDKCLEHPWAVDQEDRCWKCEEEKNQRHMKEQLIQELGYDPAPPKLDSVVTSVIEQFTKRAQFGKAKYGTDLDRTDLTLLEWLEHAKQEHMDAILYLEKIKQIVQLNERQEKII